MPPIPIAVLCVILFCWTCLGLAGVILAAGKAPLASVIWALVMDGVQFASFVGLWRLKRWAVWLYLVSFAAGVSVAFLVQAPYQLTGWDLVYMAGIPAVYLAVVLPYEKRLT